MNGCPFHLASKHLLIGTLNLECCLAADAAAVGCPRIPRVNDKG